MTVLADDLLAPVCLGVLYALNLDPSWSLSVAAAVILESGPNWAMDEDTGMEGRMLLSGGRPSTLDASRKGYGGMEEIMLSSLSLAGGNPIGSSSPIAVTARGVLRSKLTGRPVAEVTDSFELPADASFDPPLILDAGVSFTLTDALRAAWSLAVLAPLVYSIESNVPLGDRVTSGANVSSLAVGTWEEVRTWSVDCLIVPEPIINPA